MKRNFVFKLGSSLFLMTLLGVMSVAEASYLRLVPTMEIISSGPGKILVKGSMKNEGDEQAVDVKLQSIRGELILADFGNIEMSGTKSFSVELTEKQLDLETPGFHQVPFRILYRDGNRVPFSSTFLQSYTLKPGTLPEPEPPVLITFGKPINGNGAIDVVDTAALEMTLNNSSKNEVDVRLEMIEPREMKFSLSQSAMKLGPGETKNVEIKIQNAGALTGSAYVIFALVSGVSQGRAFANYGSFVTNIVVKADLPWIPILIGVLIALFVAVDLFRRFRKSSAKS